MKKTLVAITLAILFTLALVIPAFAQYMEYSGDYVMNGTISGKMQAGHLCNTGAEMKQTISGAGSMTKAIDIYMVEGKLDVDDDNDFVASATSSLTVTTAIKLCAPPKYVYTTDGGEYWSKGEAIPVEELYQVLNLQLYNDFLVNVLETDPLDPDMIAEFMEDNTKKLTKQIWAVQVSADPGFSGNLHTDFTAAYGKFGGWGHIDDEPADDEFMFLYDTDDMWDVRTGLSDKIATGKDYVGNYFMIEQFARTSMGTTKRYIDISSPFSHAFLHEDMTVVGKAEVRESFEMMNIAEGAEATTDWWDLF